MIQFGVQSCLIKQILRPSVRYMAALHWRPRFRWLPNHSLPPFLPTCQHI